MQDPTFFIVTLAILMLGVSIHEFAHAKVAFAAGDPTPRFYGRVTLNPLSHLDPIGTLMMVVSTWSGFGIGWGKPVLVNPNKMRNPRWDHFASVAAGPLSNLMQAVAFAVLLRLFITANQIDLAVVRGLIQDGASTSTLLGATIGQFYREGTVTLLLGMGVFVNIGLFLFNLMPIGPLDGHWMLGTFMPEPTRIRWYMWNRQAGSFLFLALVIIGQYEPRLNVFSTALVPATWGIFRFLVGI